MFKFLKTAPKTPIETGAAGAEPVTTALASATEQAVNGHGAAASNSSGFGRDAKPDFETTADLEPVAGVLGMAEARAALAVVEHAAPRSIFFVAQPRSSAHREALSSLLGELAESSPQVDAAVAVHDFATGELALLGLPLARARLLAERVEDAISMLSVTIPSAFESDSYRVARLALDEELRSGHDLAIDTLRRRAQAQNIGLLRTPKGYAVAPMHEGRVVQPEVFNALPGGLKADVEAKLAGFEAELSAVLKDRAGLQQSFRSRLRDLDREVASLAVQAALGDTVTSFADHPAAWSYLQALGEDLTRNAALFQSAARSSHGRLRAPVEIATDPRLTRYRVNVLAAARRDKCRLECPESLDRAELAGEFRMADGGGGAGASPAALAAGALTRAGGGLVLIDASDLLAQYSAWPMIKQALRARAITPADPAGRSARACGIALPVECRIVVTGEVADYLSWCRLDADVARIVRLVKAFEAAVALTPATERQFAQHVASILAENRFQPLDGSAVAALMHERTETADGVALLSTDLDSLRDIVAAATSAAKAGGRKVTLAEDVLHAQKARGDLLAGLEECVP